jgi:2,3,4,5-tetrahydropyridine-2,6-dicarboxylate N-succinyltransferase
VVVPGTRTRRYPAGEFQVGCALIVGQRTASTDRKTSLNEVLRDFGVST